MKQNYVPLEKRSKREQREYHASKRGSWGNINPVTRKPPNPKAYNRKKFVQWEHEPPARIFYCAAWLNGFRRLSKDYDISTSSAETNLIISHINLLLRRL